jgi:hypothetical protein
MKRRFALQAALIFVGPSVGSFVCATEIHQAVQAHDMERVADIIKTSPTALTERDLDNSTPLHYAVRFPDITRFLLDHGADPNARDDRGETPLSRAPVLEAARLLIAVHHSKLRIEMGFHQYTGPPSAITIVISFDCFFNMAQAPSSEMTMDVHPL